MSVKMTPAMAYTIGATDAREAMADPKWFKMAESNMEWARAAYPGAAALDFRAEVLKIEKERMAAEPDLSKLPECRGLTDAVAAQHKGFLDVSANPWARAYYYNWYWFISRRLNTRYVGTLAPRGQCTAVFFQNSAEGPLVGNNLDDIRRSFEEFVPPREGPAGKPIQKITQIGGVSAAILCDEEPEDIFPVPLDWVRPPEITMLPEWMEFLHRYRDFWGPHNSIWIDPEMNSAAVEKSNCRMGVRWPEDGASAITACAYLTPEMNAFKKERDRVSIERRGWDEDCPDFVFWAGCERRYHRLLELVAAESRRGPTLEGLAAILLDHAAPFPDRICLSGEQCHPSEPLTNWTLESSAQVMFGPTRRTVWSRVEGQTSACETTPFLVLGPGVEMRPEWQEAIDAGVYRTA